MSRLSRVLPLLAVGLLLGFSGCCAPCGGYGCGPCISSCDGGFDPCGGPCGAPVGCAAPMGCAAPIECAAPTCAFPAPLTCAAPAMDYGCDACAPSYDSCIGVKPVFRWPNWMRRLFSKPCGGFGCGVCCGPSPCGVGMGCVDACCPTCASPVGYHGAGYAPQFHTTSQVMTTSGAAAIPPATYQTAPQHAPAYDALPPAAPYSQTYDATPIAPMQQPALLPPATQSPVYESTPSYTPQAVPPVEYGTPTTPQPAPSVSPVPDAPTDAVPGEPAVYGRQPQLIQPVSYEAAPRAVSTEQPVMVLEDAAWPYGKRGSRDDAVQAETPWR